LLVASQIYPQLDAALTIQTLVNMALSFRNGSGITFAALVVSLRRARPQVGARWRREVENWLMSFGEK